MDLLRLSAAVASAALMASPALAQTTTPAPAPATPPAAAPTPALGGDIVDTLRAKGQFGTFLKAAEAAGILDILKGAGPIAVFAPTDQAFAALPAGQLDNLLKPENKEQLRQLLLYHTINAAVTSEQLANRKGPVPTGATTPVLLDGGGGSIKANDAKVVEADVKASNGTIFVVDKVLSPSAPAAAPAPTTGMAAASPMSMRAGFQAPPAEPASPPSSEPATTSEETARTPAPPPTLPDDAPAARTNETTEPGTAPIPGGVPRDPGDGSSPANQGMGPNDTSAQPDKEAAKPAAKPKADKPK